METRIVVDTNILIDLLRNKPYALDLFQEWESFVLTATDISAFELYFGAYRSQKQEQNLAAVKGLLNSLALFSTCEDSMELAGKIAAHLEKSQKSIEIKDLFIGSIALLNGYTIATNNVKHFKRIEGLRILGPFD